MYVDKPDTLILSIIRAAYPSYSGRKIKIETLKRINVKSYWDGGSKDSFVFVRLSDYAVQPIPQQSAFDRQIPGAEDAPIPNPATAARRIFASTKQTARRVSPRTTTTQRRLH